MPALGQTTLHIDLAAIPDFRREELANWALRLTERTFSVPGAEEEYQAWLKEWRAKGKRAVKAAQRKE